MLRSIIGKFSALFYYLHIFLRDLSAKKNTIANDNKLLHPTSYILKNKTSNSSKKICHVNGNFIVGGSTQLIIDIIENTSDLYNHMVIVPEVPNPLPYQPVDVRCYSIYDMTKLYEFLKDEKPDLVHIHYWVRHIHRFVISAYWYRAIFEICEELGIKVIQNINVPTAPFHSKSVLENVFVSNYVKNEFNDVSLSNCVIYPGSDFEHFQNHEVELLPSNAIGMVYRLDKDKLNANSINIFIKLAIAKPDLICYIIGGGYFLQCYKDKVESEGLSKQFVFTGYVSYMDLPFWYKKFSVFITPVHDESFGQVTPFAMSMGHCIAGYDVGALSEILGSKDNLVNYGEDDLLKTKILSLLSNDALRVNQGKQNQIRAQQLFDVQSMIRGYKTIYNKYI